MYVTSGYWPYKSRWNFDVTYLSHLRDSSPKIENVMFIRLPPGHPIWRWLTAWRVKKTYTDKTKWNPAAHDDIHVVDQR